MTSELMTSRCSLMQITAMQANQSLFSTGSLRSATL